MPAEAPPACCRGHLPTYLLRHQPLQQLSATDLELPSEESRDKRQTFSRRGLPIHAAATVAISRLDNDTRPSLQLPARRCPLSGPTPLHDVACHQRFRPGRITASAPTTAATLVTVTARSGLLPSIRRQWHQNFHQIFAQGPPRGVEADSRREEQISTGEESAHRGARRGIGWYTSTHGPARENRWAASWAGWRGQYSKSPKLKGRGPALPMTFSNYPGPARPMTFSNYSVRSGPARPITIFRSAQPGPARTTGPRRALMILLKLSQFLVTGGKYKDWYMVFILSISFFFVQ